jgi:hypothetical protein
VRKKAGIAEYQNSSWSPVRAVPLLRIARCMFPSLQPWTASLEKEKNAAPRIKFLAALSCETR